MASLVLLTTVLCFGLAKSTTLTIPTNSTMFYLDGKPTFLLGLSYFAFGSLSIDEFYKDLDDITKDGLNWIRLWTNWQPWAAISPTGDIVEPGMTQLKNIVQKCDENGVIADLTMGHGSPTGPDTIDDHIKCVQTLANEFKQFRNVYFDVANEHDVGDARHVTDADVGKLIDSVKQIDPERMAFNGCLNAHFLVTHDQHIRICTASGANEDSLQKNIMDGHMDFVAPHLCRDNGCNAVAYPETQKFYDIMRTQVGKIVPMHHQEPFRRGYGGGMVPVADDFLEDASGAKAAGAGGWCFHNGDNDGGRPFRCMNMTAPEGRLYVQWDSEEQNVHGRLMPWIGTTDQNTKRYQAEYEEQVQHTTGKRVEDSWQATKGEDSPGFLSTGPTAVTLPQGNWNVAWNLRLPGSKKMVSDDVVLIIGVWGADASPIASQNITAGDFPNDDWKQFSVEVKLQSDLAGANYRAQWLAVETVQCDWVQSSPSSTKLAKP